MRADIIECAKGYQAECQWGKWTAYTNPGLTIERAKEEAIKLADRLKLKLIITVEGKDDDD